MSKFALLSIFLIISIDWVYQPFTADHTDEMIDKYRPSIYNNQMLHYPDSIYKIKTTYKHDATALYIPQAIE